MPEFHAPKVHDLGGFTVERVLPNARRRSVGPFVFFDHIGPALLGGPQPVAVRPHPHIGLATVTLVVAVVSHLAPALGYRVVIVAGPSMSPTIPMGSLLVEHGPGSDGVAVGALVMMFAGMAIPLGPLAPFGRLALRQRQSR